MERNPKDSRLRYTKASLYGSLVELLGEKALPDITVTELCARAGVSRKTFYKHYSSSFALFESLQDDLFEDYRDVVAVEGPDIQRIVVELVGWAGRNRDTAKAVLADRRERSFVVRMCDDLFERCRADWEAANPSLAPRDVEALFHYVSSGAIGLVQRWLSGHLDLEADEVAAQVLALASSQVPADGAGGEL